MAIFAVLGSAEPHRGCACVEGRSGDVGAGKRHAAAEAARVRGTAEHGLEPDEPGDGEDRPILAFGDEPGAASSFHDPISATQSTLWQNKPGETTNKKKVVATKISSDVTMTEPNNKKDGAL